MCIFFKTLQQFTGLKLKAAMASTFGVSVESLVQRQDDFQHFGGQPNKGSHYTVKVT